MSNCNEKSKNSYIHSLNTFDIVFVFVCLIVLTCIYISEIYHEYKQESWWNLYKIADAIQTEIAYKFLSASIIFIFVSTIIRHTTKSSDNKSWRYLAIIAFSILGSVVVSLLTLSKPSEAPFIWALTILLFHLGYWCWKREHIETSKYQEDIQSSTLRLEKIINTMPSELAFKVMGKNTSDIFEKYLMLYDMSTKTNEAEDKKFIKAEAKKQLQIALRSMCQIASLWATSRPRLFEANIMLVKDSKNVDEIPNVQDAFNRGKYFFPDLTTLKTISNSCEKCLYVIPELAINDEKQNIPVNVKPLLLPIGIKSEIYPGTIKGAPEAVEKGAIVSINDVNDIVCNLPANYVEKQKQEIQSYFDAQTNCGSILSIPLLCEYGNESNNIQSDAVINLYRPEKGLIKSPILFQDLTKPLVLMIANLLYLYLDTNITLNKSSDNPIENSNN